MSVLGKIVSQLKSGGGDLDESNVMYDYYSGGVYTKYELPENSFFIHNQGVIQDHVPTNNLYRNTKTGETIQMTINGKTLTSTSDTTSLDFENYEVRLYRDDDGRAYMFLAHSNENLPIEGTLVIANIKINQTSYPDETIPFKICYCRTGSDMLMTSKAIQKYVYEQVQIQVYKLDANLDRIQKLLEAKIRQIERRIEALESK